MKLSKSSVLALIPVIVMAISPALLVAQPAVVVTMPIGGENWTSGEKHAIHWDWTGNVSLVKLDYSTNSGSAWTTISPSTTGDGHYLWTVPTTPSTHCRVRVRDASDTLIQSMSDADFMIVRPAIFITRPDSGESYVYGGRYSIHWNWTGVFTNVKLDYSTNGGTSWTAIVANTPNNGDYLWVAPATPASACRVRVSDAADSATVQVSPAFAIARSRINLITPKGTERYHGGVFQPIHWNWTGDFTDAALDYSTDAGTTWISIAASVPNNGRYAWNVPHIAARQDTACRVRVVNVTDAQAFGASLVNFTIDTVRLPDSIAVFSPLTSDRWISGRHYFITWGGQSKATTVNVELSADSGQTWTTIAAGVADSGKYDWLVPDTAGSLFGIKVSNAARESTFGVIVPFVIERQTIAVTSHNHYDAWFINQPSVITWTWTGGFTNARLDYSTNDGQTWNPIAASIANNGSYDWTAPNVAAESCRVRVTDADDPAVSGTSERFRLIPPTIKVSSPSQDNILLVGRKYWITWSWTGTLARSHIDYSYDRLATWHDIAASDSNSGSYEWTVPPPATANGRVRVSNADNARSADTSLEFEIHTPPGAAEKPGAALPLVSALHELKPNPATSGLRLAYDLARPGRARLSICDITGRTITTLVDRKELAGRFTATWDGRDQVRRLVPAGVYVCVLQAGDFRATRNLTIIR